MIKSLFRLISLWLIDILGINALCRMLNQDKAIILCYHGICDDTFNLAQRHLSKTMFRKQLSYLKQKGYIFVNMSEMVSLIKSGGKIGKHIVITFDDGLKNVVENAYPIMREFHAKGCFYLVSDLIGTDQLLWTDYVETVIRNHKENSFHLIYKGEKIHYKLNDKKLCEYAIQDSKAKLRALPDKERLEHLEQFDNFKLNDIPREFLMASWEQISGLDPNVIEIGSHTRKHPNCANLTSDKELEDELNYSKIDIEKNIGRKIEHFCYPAGSYDDRTITKLKEYGYKSAVTIENGLINETSDFYQLNRVLSNDDFLFFKASVSGTSHMIRKLIRPRPRTSNA